MYRIRQIIWNIYKLITYENNNDIAIILYIKSIP